MGTTTEVPKIPEITTFKERISGLKRAALVEIAKDEFQLNIDSKVKADVLRDTLQRVHEQRATSALEKNQAAAQLFLERDSNEQVVTVQFLPLEFPNNPLHFSWDGGFGITDRKNPKRNPNGLKRMPTFFLIPGEIYQLPICVIRHLEKQVYRDAKPIYDIVTGMQAGFEPIIKPRFMLRVLLPDAAMHELGSRDFAGKE